MAMYKPKKGNFKPVDVNTEFNTKLDNPAINVEQSKKTHENHASAQLHMAEAQMKALNKVAADANTATQDLSAKLNATNAELNDVNQKLHDSIVVSLELKIENCKIAAVNNGSDIISEAFTEADHACSCVSLKADADVAGVTIDFDGHC